MDVPNHIRPFKNDDDYIPMSQSTHINGTFDSMIVPDRILVAGGKAKQQPLEIALDMHSLPPVGYSRKVLETPPAKLTLQDRNFPTVGDYTDTPSSPQFQYRRNSIGSGEATKLESIDRSMTADQKKLTRDGLPSSSTLSLLTPSEELVLLRNHVRKLTTRVIKLEENVQDLNTHVGWIEGLGGALFMIFVLKSLKSMFWGGRA